MSPGTAEFELPALFHYTATFLLALTGAMAGRRRNYDIVGVFVMAFVAGLGGALLRDGIFLDAGSPLSMRDGHYLPVVLAASVIGSLWFEPLDRFALVFNLLDAAGLAIYAIVGTQLALAAPLPVPAAMFIGTVNAVGGSLLRDVLVREEPLLFKPSHYYALAAVLGCGAFVLLRALTPLPGVLSGSLAVLLIFAIRVLAIRYDWKTSPLRL